MLVLRLSAKSKSVRKIRVDVINAKKPRIHHEGRRDKKSSKTWQSHIVFSIFYFRI
jgi:hypothetical protein